METLRTFVFALLTFLAEAAPFVIAGFFAAALVKEFVPVKVFVRYFGGHGAGPLLRALGVGALLPICSCGVVPVGVGAFQCGAPRGTTLTFLTSAPCISPVAVLIAVSVLGWKMALCFAGTALIGALLIGALGNRLLSGPEEDALRARTKTAKDDRLPVSKNRTLRAKVRGAAKWAFWDLGTDISVDLFFGLALAAALIALLPVGWVSTWLGEQSLWTLLCVIAVGIPLYTCTIPSLTVVKSMIVLGLSPGAAVAYLISGPATCLGDINVVRKSLGGKTAALLVGGLVVTSLLGGLVTDFLVFPNYDYKASFVGGEAVMTGCCVSPIFGDDDPTSKFESNLAGISPWRCPFMAVLATALSIGLVRRSARAIEKLRARLAGGRKADGAMQSAVELDTASPEQGAVGT